MKILSLIENELSDFFEKRINIKSNGLLYSGSVSKALKIETSMGSFFIKWGKAEDLNMFLSEAEGLKALKKASNDNVLIPDVLMVKCVNGSFSFILLEFLETNMPFRNADEKLGMGLAEIHKCTCENFGFKVDNFCGSTLQNNRVKNSWTDFYIENRLLFLMNQINKKYLLTINDQKSLEKFIFKLPTLIPDNVLPSLIHGDLWSGNYLSTNRGPALIDPCVSYSHREMEFGIITLFGGFSKRFFDSYNNCWPLEKDWKERNPIYQFYHLLNHYLIFGGSYLLQAKQISKYYS